MKARYADGLSARMRDVDLEVRGGELLIRGADAAAAWPLDSLTRRSTSDPGVILVSPRDADGAQLTIELASAAALLEAAPQLARDNARAATLRIAAPLIVVGLATIWLVFFGLPAMSGPIARAIPPETERQLGAQTEAFVSLFAENCDTGAEAQAVLDDLAARFAGASSAPFDVRVRLVDANFPNALALPGGQILVTDELLDVMETPEELAGVLAHETAHLARRHVMAALVRQIGYGFVLDLVLGGGSGAGQQIAMAGASLNSLRHSRGAEAEADALALEYLETLDIDGTGLAQFFERLNEFLEEEAKDRRGPEIDFPELLSTHPNTEARAMTARENAGASRTPALSAADWMLVKAGCGDQNDDDEKTERPGDDS